MVHTSVTDICDQLNDALVVDMAAPSEFWLLHFNSVLLQHIPKYSWRSFNMHATNAIAVKLKFSREEDLKVNVQLQSGAAIVYI